jgi:hypothetical protein
MALEPNPLPNTEKIPNQPPVDPNPNLKADETKPPVDPVGRQGSIYKDIGDDEPGTGKATAWADNWRETLATGDDGKVDEKQLAMLKRHSTPKAWHNSNMAAQQRIRSGEYKRSAPDNPDDPKAMDAWREENGIPKAPTEYQITAPGIDIATLDEGSKKNVATIQEAFHKSNLTGDQAKSVSSTLINLANEQLAAQTAADAASRDLIEDALRAEWGKDYRPNLNANIQVMERYFGDDTDAILTARLPDGRLLSSLPSFNKGINAWARGEGGDIIFDGEGSGGTSIEGRIKEIEAVMNTSMAKYLQTPGMADEYGALLEKQQARVARK